jgi:hypothetical protein
MSNIDDCADLAGETQDPTKTQQKIRVEYLERALSTLKSIARGGGSNPQIYAQNTLDSIGEKY